MGGIGNFRTISGEELRRRIDALGLSYVEASRKLGLTEDGLYKQMRGTRRVGRQTAIILGYLERELEPKGARRQGELPIERQTRRDRRLAQYLYPSAPRRK
jgi:hypothetical protein